MKLSFDLDGVLCDFSREAIKTIRALYPCYDLPPDYEHTVWSFSNTLTSQEWEHVFSCMMNQDNFWTHLPAFEENVAAVSTYLETHGEQDIYFVTARPDCNGGSAKSMTALWLMDHRLPFGNLIVVPSHAAKRDVLAQHGIQAHLDDYAPTIKACQGLPGLRAYVLDRKYNQGATDLPRVYSAAEYLLEAELNA
ncbi:5' nucleotidase, deoxy (Pyrimidine), cytosolic type C protein (NT5C) [uncultured archaeon]|nr:5' nucleotidase, deoxy (Pyrimidine), cytosolic type C protein (NT5C) [uncultured archaeon]